MASNPRCPNCGHYNAMLDEYVGREHFNKKCRDCGFVEVHPDNEPKPDSPMVRHFKEQIAGSLGIHERGQESLAEARNQLAFVAFYKGRQLEIRDADSQYDAKKKAIKRMNVPKSKEHWVSVVLSEKNGEQVTHVADF